MSVVLHESDLYLRILEKDDASDEYLSWLVDHEVNRYLEARFVPVQTIDSLKDYIGLCTEDDDVFLFGIFITSNHSHIGNVKLGPINRHHKRADLGFFVGDKNTWGKGYATRAIKRVLNYGFEQLGLEKITAGCYSHNYGSKAVLLKAGFLLEGALKGHWLLDGVRQDGFVFGITKEHWKING